MFKSKEELKSLMYDILNTLNNDSNVDNLVSKFKSKDKDFNTALEECINRNLILGITRRCNQNSVMLSADNPRLSYEGLKFIEDFKK
jgi:hypothetical protein